MITLTNTERKKRTRELFEIYVNSPDHEKRELEEKIYQLNIPLIHSTLHKCRVPMSKYADFYQVGSLALVMAIRKFRLSENTMFSTYAVNMIKGEIKHSYRDDEWFMKVSRVDKEKGGRLILMPDEEKKHLDIDCLEQERLIGLINAQQPTDLTYDLIHNHSKEEAHHHHLTIERDNVADEILSICSDSEALLIEKRFINDHTVEELAFAFLRPAATIDRQIVRILNKCKRIYRSNDEGHSSETASHRGTTKQRRPGYASPH